MRGTTDDTACPVCGESYADRIVVGRGDRWSDLYAGTPFSFFKRYRRRCTARYDVDDDEQLADDERAVYFHDADGGGRALF